MKIRFLNISTFLLAVLLVIFWACRKEKPELTLPKADPCELDKPVEASFWIGQKAEKQVIFNPSIYNSSYNLTMDTILPTDYDTLNCWGAFYFTANADCYDELEWDFGHHYQKIYGKQVYMTFNFNYIDSVIPITLIAKKKPSLACYPEDDGVDTVTRMVKIINQNLYSTGYFQGINVGENPSDTFTVWIKPMPNPTNPPGFYNIYDIIGLPKNSCSSCDDVKVTRIIPFYLFRRFYFPFGSV